MTAETSYCLPEGCFYIDAAAAKEYAAHTGTEVVIRQVMNVTPGEALDVWVKQAWLAGAKDELTPGEGRALLNHSRSIAGIGLTEQITSAGLPSDTDAAGAVPSVAYKVLDFGSLPADDHIALLRFVPVGETQTEVVWAIKLQLKAEGTAMFPDPSAIKPFLFSVISGLLTKISADVDAPPEEEE